MKFLPDFYNAMSCKHHLKNIKVFATSPPWSSSSLLDYLDRHAHEDQHFNLKIIWRSNHLCVGSNGVHQLSGRPNCSSSTAGDSQRRRSQESKHDFHRTGASRWSNLAGKCQKCQTPNFLEVKSAETDKELNNKHVTKVSQVSRVKCQIVKQYQRC